MNDTSQDVRATLLAGSGDMPPGIDLLRGVREHAATQPRQRRRRRALVCAGAVVVSAGVAAATLLATSATSPPSALAAVTSAAAKTSAQSYRFTMGSTTTITGQRSLARAALSGAMDPRRGVGAEQLIWRDGNSSITAQIRFIGRYVYTRSSGAKWARAPIPGRGYNVLPQLSAAGSERPLVPAQLLAELRSATTVRRVGPASGPGWTGTKYAFTGHLKSYPDRFTITGTVYVDQQGRVRGLATTTTMHPARLLITSRYVITFADFGGPVQVTAPPPSQTGNAVAPFWVFPP